MPQAFGAWLAPWQYVRTQIQQLCIHRMSYYWVERIRAHGSNAPTIGEKISSHAEEEDGLCERGAIAQRSMSRPGIQVGLTGGMMRYGMVWYGMVWYGMVW